MGCSVNEGETAPQNGVQILSVDNRAPLGPAFWCWRLLWRGRVVGQSAPGQTFATKADAYENYKLAVRAMEHQLGRSTWRVGAPIPVGEAARPSWR